MYEVGVVRDGITIMLCYNRHNWKQAKEEGKKHGRVLFTRKVNKEKILGIGEIEHMRLEPNQQVKVRASPYRSAVAMDELIGQKRNARRNNLYKDKEELDNKKIM